MRTAEIFTVHFFLSIGPRQEASSCWIDFVPGILASLFNQRAGSVSSSGRIWATSIPVSLPIADVVLKTLLLPQYLPPAVELSRLWLPSINALPMSAKTSDQAVQREATRCIIFNLAEEARRTNLKIQKFFEEEVSTEEHVKSPDRCAVDVVLLL